MRHICITRGGHTAAVWAVLGTVFVVFLIFLDVPWNYPVVAAVVITGYVALFAKSDCLAVIRGGKTCRNNAKGLLRACHIQQHNARSRYGCGLRAAASVMSWRRAATPSRQSACLPRTLLVSWARSPSCSADALLAFPST
jgi:hypothetical protein